MFLAQLVLVIQHSREAMQKREYLDAAYIHLALLLLLLKLDRYIVLCRFGKVCKVMEIPILLCKNSKSTIVTTGASC